MLRLALAIYIFCLPSPVLAAINCAAILSAYSAKLGQSSSRDRDHFQALMGLLNRTLPYRYQDGRKLGKETGEPTPDDFKLLREFRDQILSGKFSTGIELKNPDPDFEQILRQAIWDDIARRLPPSKGLFFSKPLKKTIDGKEPRPSRDESFEKILKASITEVMPDIDKYESKLSLSDQTSMRILRARIASVTNPDWIYLSTEDAAIIKKVYWRLAKSYSDSSIQKAFAVSLTRGGFSTINRGIGLAAVEKALSPYTDRVRIALDNARARKLDSSDRGSIGVMANARHIPFLQILKSSKAKVPLLTLYGSALAVTSDDEKIRAELSRYLNLSGEPDSSTTQSLKIITKAYYAWYRQFDRIASGTIRWAGIGLVSASVIGVSGSILFASYFPKEAPLAMNASQLWQAAVQQSIDSREYWGENIADTIDRLKKSDLAH